MLPLGKMNTLFLPAPQTGVRNDWLHANLESGRGRGRGLGWLAALICMDVGKLKSPGFVI